MTDEEYGEWLAQFEEEPTDAPPMSPLGYTPEIARLDRMIDVLKQVIQVQMAAAGGKAPPMKPEPRPVTAEQQARKRRDRRDVEDVLAELGVL